MEQLRKTLAVLAGVATAWMLVVTFTVPMIAVTGPAILTIGLAVLTWALWPKRARDRLDTAR